MRLAAAFYSSFLTTGEVSRKEQEVIGLCPLNPYYILPTPQFVHLGSNLI